MSVYILFAFLMLHGTFGLILLIALGIYYVILNYKDWLKKIKDKF